VKHGIFLPPFGPFGDPAVLVDLAVAAEHAGWDGFFLWDHLRHRVDGPYVDAWIALAAIAARTERLRIGPLITPLPRRRPWKLAREAVSLDHLSRGRLVLGAGIGTDHSREFTAFGEPGDDRTHAELLDEGLEVVTQLWTGEYVHHHGAHFHIDNVQFLPRPLQQPRIPIWCGAHWRHRAPLRRAARYDGVVPIGDLPPDALKDLLSDVRRHRTSDRPFDVAISSWTATAGPAQYEAAGATWWLEAFRPETPLKTAQSAVERGPGAASPPGEWTTDYGRNRSCRRRRLLPVPPIIPVMLTNRRSESAGRTRSPLSPAPPGP
jgi:alkanesulfonate monooxygenase SsuD/methylene tetrahydromethanopterin reductase-like flavin-dependent oxidoreductase (luciferase family)